MTDCEFILDLLGDGEEHTLAEILTRSMNERGCGLTTHSRVADLRKKGYVIEHLTVQGAERGHAHTYRLLQYPTERVEATTTPEGASGMGRPGRLGTVLAGGHGLDVAPDASPEGVRAETRREEDGAGGGPSNAPVAELTLFADARPLAYRELAA